MESNSNEYSIGLRSERDRDSRVDRVWFLKKEGEFSFIRLQCVLPFASLPEKKNDFFLTEMEGETSNSKNSEIQKTTNENEWQILHHQYHQRNS